MSLSSCRLASALPNRDCFRFRCLQWIAVIALVVQPGPFAEAQEPVAQDYDVQIEEALELVRSAIWYNSADGKGADGASLAMKASNVAKAKWGTQDKRFLRAMSIFSLGMSQNLIDVILKAKGDTTKMIESADELSKEAGLIAMNQTNDGEVALLATLVRARLAKIKKDPASAAEMYDFLVESLGEIMPPENPIFIAVKAERGR